AHERRPFSVTVPSVFRPQEQPKIIEPLDYEAVVFQRKAQIHSDPHRDLLLCPVDDVSVSLRPSSPPEQARKFCCLFRRKGMYNSDWRVINYKYEAYSGDFRMLPRYGG
uniref:Dedicator of cytokinesis C/D N-terminal domain-containing protein n=1 Tax=Oryzias latipes TaxID=8090 RepID=A0A3B3I8Z8_ORYLA